MPVDLFHAGFCGQAHKFLLEIPVVIACRVNLDNVVCRRTLITCSGARKPDNQGRAIGIPGKLANKVLPYPRYFLLRIVPIQLQSLWLRRKFLAKTKFAMTQTVALKEDHIVSSFAPLTPHLTFDVRWTESLRACYKVTDRAECQRLRNASC